MRIILHVLVFLVFFMFGCKKRLSETDIERNLTVAMTRFLNSPPRVDTSKVKFTVVDVTFFDNKSSYECEFKIHLVSPGKDTTGIMAASISKDFERILRKN